MLVVIVVNVVDFHGSPSSLHKCPHPLVDAPKPLESWYHVISQPFSILPSYVSPMEMTFVVPLHSTDLLILMLGL
jgi:hypothetical protein